MLRPRLRAKSILVVVNVLGTLALGIALFYRSPLRDEMETRLADLKTRIMPSPRDSGRVAVVSIDEATIQALGGSKAKDLDYASLARLTELAVRAGAKAVVPLMHTQVFPYDAAERVLMLRLAAQYPQVFLGVMDLDRRLGWRSEAGAVTEERTYAARLVAVQLEVVVTEVPIFKAVADASMPYLVGAVADYLNPSRSRHFNDELSARGLFRSTRLMPDAKSMRLNFFDLKHVTRVSGARLAAKPENFDFREMVVVIGYGVFRPANFRVIEATFLNTPWQNTGDPVENGVPLTDIFAVAFDNFLSDSWLRQAPFGVNIVQTVAVALLGARIWQASSAVAVLLYGLGFGVLLVIHAVARNLWFVEIPTADCLFFGTLATFAGGFWRLKAEIRERAKHEAIESSERDIMRTQERFLNRFSFDLSAINLRITGLLKTSIAAALPADQPALLDIHHRAVEGAQELEEYLTGIKQLATVFSQEPKKLRFEVADARSITDRVARRFDARAQEARQRIAIDSEGDTCLRTDAVLVEQILHNLISNAVKYSPHEALVHIVVTGNQHHVDIAVHDQGPGIAAEFRDKIFEKFYRIPNDTAYKVKGTGVGLFLSRYFAELIGGSLLLESTEGRGSTFTLRLARRGRA